MTQLPEIQERFNADTFATGVTEIKIDDARKDWAQCSLRIGKKHLNAAGTVMGGVLFTLADFTFAVAANTENPLTVSLSSSINFLHTATEGTCLTAETDCIKTGKSTCFFQVYIRDENNTPIASASFTGFRKST